MLFACRYDIDLTYVQTSTRQYQYLFNTCFFQDLIQSQRALIPVGCTVIVVCCVTLTFVYIKPVFKRCSLWITSGLCVFLFLMSVVYSALHPVITAVTNLPLAYYLIIVIYTCIPASVPTLIVMVLAFVVVEMVSSGLMANSYRENMAHQVCDLELCLMLPLLRCLLRTL